MKIQYYIISALLLGALAYLNSCQTGMKQSSDNETVQKTRSISSANAKKYAAIIRQDVAVQVDEGMELSLWASDSLIHDPIAISIDNEGKIYYTSASRQENSEFDIRGHRNWMTASISFETPEDRRAFLRETFTADSEESKKHLKDLNNDGLLDWRDLTVEKEEIWWVADQDKDGVAESAQLFIKDFNEEITDVANGILVHDNNVYAGVAPDLWKITDEDSDGFGDKTESLSRGYAVHIGFSGHGMSGVTVGPDGRIWWGIGDIGMSVTDKSGKKWDYPNQGVIVRCDPDGSNFEVYSAGHRNTHEFVFDKYGNLITEDNDGDHRGERERLVYVINGSDSGWRSNWQFGKYTDPHNNTYKVWMDEKMSIPRWDGQAAYIIPPIQNYVNGPTGMVYNPGTALSEKWYDHFFIAEFRGNPANSPIHAFTMEADGAGFKLGETQEVVSGLLPTGLDFGPDGALYFGDWIDGWGTKDEGRIWKLDVPGAGNSTIRQETKKLISEDFKVKANTELGTLLAHQDMRIRLKAQFALAKKGDEGLAIFTKYLDAGMDQMQRIHSIWGIGQMARTDGKDASVLTQLLSDSDLEVQAQAIKTLGDLKFQQAGEKIIPLLASPSPRIQMLSAEALGRMENKAATQKLIDLLIQNDDKDVYIRHAASLALAKIEDPNVLRDNENHPSDALRLALVVTGRRMGNENVKLFLDDKNEKIVTEAARAINDDRSIMGAMSDLASILNTTPFSNEALLRRSINANFRLGEKEHIENLLTFLKNTSASPEMRAETLDCLATWETPSPLDRVDGRNRNLGPRDGSYVKVQMAKNIDAIADDAPRPLRIAVAKAISKLEMKDKSQMLEDLFYNSDEIEFKKESLIALNQIKSKNIDKLLESALVAEDSDLRATALSLIPESNLDETKAIDLFSRILNEGSMIEKQTAFATISKYKGNDAKALLESKVNDLVNNKIEPEIRLDLIEAVNENGDQELMKQIKAYHASKNNEDTLAEYEECLTGGDIRKGRNIFFRDEAAQCVRCHSIYEWGGDAGPGLQGIASKISTKQLLQALVNPSDRLAPGFGVLSLELNDGTSIAGVMEEETENAFVLKVSKDEVKSIDKSKIKSQSFLPSSMPSVKTILDKKQIRDLVAFLGSLEAKEEG